MLSGGGETVEGIGRCEIESFLDVFKETTVAIRARERIGNPNESATTITPVRSRSHGNRDMKEGKMRNQIFRKKMIDNSIWRI